jgi:hypothetical protein
VVVVDECVTAGGTGPRSIDAKKLMLGVVLVVVSIGPPASLESLDSDYGTRESNEDGDEDGDDGEDDTNNDG